MNNMQDYPVILTENRGMLESGLIFSIWKQPLLYDDFKALDPMKDFLLEESRFYFGLGLKLKSLGYQVFDVVTIAGFMETNDNLKAIYESYGGWNTVKEIMSIVSAENAETYYQELMKWNSILELHDTGYDMTKELSKFKLMNISDLESYFEYKMNNVFLSRGSSGTKAVDIASGYGKFIEEWDKGESVGIKIGASILNYTLAGIHHKNLHIHLGHIGNGKTTLSLPLYILPALEEEKKVCILANEQDESEFRQMLLSTVLFNKIKYFKINRQKFLFGGFTEEDKDALKQAEEWLMKYENNLLYVNLPTYSIEDVRRIIRKYSKLGVELFFYDTMKQENDSSDKAWGEFSEVAKELFNLAKQQNVAIIATAQLATSSYGRKYLDLNCVGKSRAISETASTVVMFRSVQENEKEKLKVWKNKRDSTGKLTNVKETIELSPDKDYIILFVAKNRFGASNIQIVYERNMSFNTVYEIGFTEVEYDGFGR